MSESKKEQQSMSLMTTSSFKARMGVINPLLVGVLSLALWVAAEVQAVIWKSESDEQVSQTPLSVSTAIRIIFPLNILFSMGSIYILRRSNSMSIGNSNGLSSRNIWGIFVPSLSIFVIIFLRLVAGQQHFQTYPPNLDFGPKYGLVYTNDGSTVETNVAFDPEFNSFSHCIQGVLAPILAYLHAILLQGEKPRRYCRWVVSLAASAMTIYPIYNFIKRVIKSHETFATSSFSNNGMEWALGFVGGLGCGQFLYIFSTTRSLAESTTTSDENESVTTDDAPGIIVLFQSLLGIALSIAVYGAAVMYGYTWNNCGDDEENGTECILDPEAGAKIGVIIGFVAVPVCFSLVTSCCMILSQRLPLDKGTI